MAQRHTRTGTTTTTERAALVAICVAATLFALACKGRDRLAADSLGDTLGANPVPACAVPTTVTASGVGPVRLGQTLAHVREICTVTTMDTALAEGMQEHVSVVHFGPHRVLLLTSGGGDSTVARIVVADSAFRTGKGVGVNASVGMIRDAYGQICAAMGEGAVVVTAPEVAGISFATSANPNALPQGGRTIGDHPEAIPDSAHVTTLWIHQGDGALCGGS